MTSKLINAFKAPLSEYHLEKLKYLDNTDFTKVKEKVKKELGITSEKYLDEGIHNLKIYYALPVLDPLNPHAISPQIDPFWHFHVLFTKDYIKFCNELVGEYMHHEPLMESDSYEKKRIRKLYTYTIKTNKILLKNIDQNWWPNSNINDDSQLICHHHKHSESNNNIIIDGIIKNALFSMDTSLD